MTAIAALADLAWLMSSDDIAEDDLLNAELIYKAGFLNAFQVIGQRRRDGRRSQLIEDAIEDAMRMADGGQWGLR